jgi:hyaluronan synthase
VRRRHGARLLSLTALLGAVGVCGLIAWHVCVKLAYMHGGPLLPVYTVLVSGYVLSRFALAACYRPPRDAGITPTVAIVVPAFNEGEAVARTIHSCLALDYPADRLEVVVVNDGSSDDTWAHMERAASQYPEGRVRCLDLGTNQGKRAAMAAGIRATSAEILVFVDSDSMPGVGAVRRLVQGFADPKVGAISGLSYVRNADTNVLTRMQAARYYVSFQLLKSAESVLGAVTCCSGCFAAYRRAAIAPLLDRWEHQRFLGVECTYGDDRALTNRVIRTGWKTVYDARAEAWTDAPDRYRKFFRQQLRWKKSWTREGPLLLAHIWRSRPLAFPSVLVQTIAGLMGPIVVLASLATPLAGGEFPMIYFLGLYLVSMGYALLYRMLRDDGLWIYAFVGTFFYVLFSPQLVWALARLRDGSWGTRAPEAPVLVEGPQPQLVQTAGNDA